MPPTAIVWQVEGGERRPVRASRSSPPRRGAELRRAPRASSTSPRASICHSDPERFALLYALLLKLRANRRAMEDRADPLLDRLERMAKEVRRDIHKMHAFVRFREVEDEAGARFVAWFEPDHHIVRATAGFFVRRFANMRWSILTPELSIHWDGETLTEGPGATRADAPDGDPVEEVWKTYYASIFNPARVKVKAMIKEMPKKYWKNMPETALIGELLAGAQEREAEMIDDVDGARSRCRDRTSRRRGTRCATRPQAAPAATSTNARPRRCSAKGRSTRTILFVGEQPGDQEDLAGRPFVGPAGQLFDAALAEAGIDRADDLRHQRGQAFQVRRSAARGASTRSPTRGEIEACRWWLEQERALIRPPLTVALGATAARSLFGKVGHHLPRSAARR